MDLDLLSSFNSEHKNMFPGYIRKKPKIMFLQTVLPRTVPFLKQI